MTLLVATVTDAFALLSQDTAVYGGDAAPSADVDHRTASDIDDAIRSTFVGDGVRQDVMPLRFGLKIRVLPQLHMAIGGTGDATFFSIWADILASQPFGADIAAIDAEAPGRLRGLLSMIETATPSSICHIGNSGGRPCGFVYNQADGFVSAPLAPNGGHLMSPPPWTAHEDYPEVWRLWEPAVRGEDTEAFHVALARNQHAAYRAGQFRPGALIGGQVVSCRVDRDGLHIRVTHEFPEHREQLTALRTQTRAAVAFLRPAAHDAPAPLGPDRHGPATPPS